MSMLPVAASENVVRGRKNVLLIDARQVIGEMRASILRDRGVDVDVAQQIPAARALWNRNRYDLVLFDFRQDAVLVDQLVGEIRHANPHQKVAFFVGGPSYWSLSPAKRKMA
jgi:DNA-binding NtrC family response regulator